MAKNNVFLGSGSGSVGDVVLMRRNGKQVARVRVREINNPKSDGQSFQRAVFSPVSKFYAPLAGVLETSWEGKNKSSSQSAFLKANLGRARSNKWINYKGAGFFPFPYQLSEGTLLPLSVTQDAAVTTATAFLVGVPNAQTTSPTTFAELSRLLVAAGYQEGDQITIIRVAQYESDESTIYSPLYSRVFVDTTSADSLAEMFPFAQVTWKEGALQFNFASSPVQNVAFAVIVSRWNGSKWLRSTSYMVLEMSMLDFIDDDYDGIIASYQTSATEPTSDVYLNGSGANRSPSVAIPTITMLRVGGVNVPAGSTTSISVASLSSIPIYAYVANGDNILAELSLGFVVSGQTFAASSLPIIDNREVSVDDASLSTGTYNVCLCVDATVMSPSFATIVLSQA